MARQDASASAASTQLAGLIPDILDFFYNPRMPKSNVRWNRAAVIVLVAIIGFHITIIFGLTSTLDLVDLRIPFLPEQVPFRLTPMQSVISLMILAPLLEEALFRGWLNGRRASLRFAYWGFVACAIAISGEFYVMRNFTIPIMLLSIGFTTVGFIQWVRTHARDNDVPHWFTRHYRWFVWGGSLAFALFHLGSYEPVSSPQGLLVVLPYFIDALLLAYTRCRFGLRAAIIHHAALNAAYLAGYFTFN